MITQKELKELLHYDPETGIFTWKATLTGTAKKGGIAGHQHKSGYIKIMIRGKYYYAHRLAWLYINAKFPEKYIDHINQTKNDNRIDNLREATNSQNQMNISKHPRNTSGVRGVCYNKQTVQWKVQMRVNGKDVFLGYYDYLIQAKNVRLEAEKYYFGEFAN